MTVQLHPSMEHIPGGALSTLPLRNIRHHNNTDHTIARSHFSPSRALNTLLLPLILRSCQDPREQRAGLFDDHDRLRFPLPRIVVTSFKARLLRRHTTSRNLLDPPQRSPRSHIWLDRSVDRNRIEDLRLSVLRTMVARAKNPKSTYEFSSFKSRSFAWASIPAARSPATPTAPRIARRDVDQRRTGNWLGRVLASSVFKQARTCFPKRWGPD